MGEVEVEEHRDNRWGKISHAVVSLFRLPPSALVTSPLLPHTLRSHQPPATCRSASLPAYLFSSPVSGSLQKCLPGFNLHHLCALLSPPQPIHRSFYPPAVECFRQLGALLRAHLVSLRVRGRACTRLHVGVCVMPEMLAFSPDYPGSLSITAWSNLTPRGPLHLSRITFYSADTGGALKEIKDLWIKTL